MQTMFILLWRRNLIQLFGSGSRPRGRGRPSASNTNNNANILRGNAQSEWFWPVLLYFGVGSWPRPPEVSRVTTASMLQVIAKLLRLFHEELVELLAVASAGNAE